MEKRKSIKNKRIIAEEIIVKTSRNVELKTICFFIENDEDLEQKYRNFSFCIGSSNEHLLMYRDCDDITILITNIFKTNLDGVNVFLLEEDVRKIVLKNKVRYE